MMIIKKGDKINNLTKNKMKEKTYINIIQWIIIIVLFSTLIVVADTGIKKAEKLECQKWQEWETMYSHFTASESMREQCEMHEIELEERRWER